MTGEGIGQALLTGIAGRRGRSSTAGARRPGAGPGPLRARPCAASWSPTTACRSRSARVLRQRSAAPRARSALAGLSAVDPAQLRPLAVRGRAPGRRCSRRAAGTATSSTGRAPTVDAVTADAAWPPAHRRTRRKPRPRSRRRRRCDAGRIGRNGEAATPLTPQAVWRPSAGMPRRRRPYRCRHAHPTHRPPRDRAPGDARRHGRGLVPPARRRRLRGRRLRHAWAPRRWARRDGRGDGRGARADRASRSASTC